MTAAGGEVYDGPERRAGGEVDRRAEFCPMHIEQVKSTSRHSGQLKIIVLIISVFSVAALTLAGGMLYTTFNIDKVFTTYIATHKIETAEVLRQISMNRADLASVKDDVIVLREITNGHEYRLGTLEGRRRESSAPLNENGGKGTGP